MRCHDPKYRCAFAVIEFWRNANLRVAIFSLFSGFLHLSGYPTCHIQNLFFTTLLTPLAISSSHDDCSPQRSAPLPRKWTAFLFSCSLFRTKSNSCGVRAGHRRTHFSQCSLLIALFATFSPPRSSNDMERADENTEKMFVCAEESTEKMVWNT